MLKLNYYFYVGTLERVSITIEVGFTMFVVESDSLTLINHLKNNDFGLAPYRHILMPLLVSKFLHV